MRWPAAQTARPLQALLQPQVDSCGLPPGKLSRDIGFSGCAGDSTDTSSVPMDAILRLFVTVAGVILDSMLMAVLGAIRWLLQLCQCGRRFFCCSVRLISLRVHGTR